MTSVSRLELRHGAYGGPGWRAIAIAGGAAIGAVLFLFLIAVPLVARHARSWVSPRMEAALGQQTADSLIPLLTHAPGTATKAECQNPRGLAALARLIEPLSRQVDWPNPPHVRVIDTPMVNAIALPGGQVLLFRGMIDFAADPNELAGILLSAPGKPTGPIPPVLHRKSSAQRGARQRHRSGAARRSGRPRCGGLESPQGHLQLRHHAFPAATSRAAAAWYKRSP